MGLNRSPVKPVHGLAAIVGLLVCVEIASGVLQGFYTPILPQIADHLSISEGDVNWFEAAQLIVSALCVPFLARLGDLIGHQKVLLLSTAVTALGSWMLAFAPSFSTFLIGCPKAPTSCGCRWRSPSSTAAPATPGARSC